ncbi:MAG: hypothetical protein LBK47_01495 [Prevotellaceae bacterium]|jgi:hypothetical protein|nr:hypothetical protein [Prevotellaceae bacterium]
MKKTATTFALHEATAALQPDWDIGGFSVDVLKALGIPDRCIRESYTQDELIEAIVEYNAGISKAEARELLKATIALQQDWGKESFPVSALRALVLTARRSRTPQEPIARLYTEDGLVEAIVKYNPGISQTEARALYEATVAFQQDWGAEGFSTDALRAGGFPVLSVHESYTEEELAQTVGRLNAYGLTDGGNR